MTLANAAQYAAWNGDAGERWVASADRRDAVLAPIADLLLANATITPGERVLDIGCGCGATTLAAAAATGAEGAVLGADLSEAMLNVARARGGREDNVELRQADIQTDPLGDAFDVAISRFGTMFFDDPAAAFTNVARHLAPGGRLCIATWQPLEANQWLIVPGAALLEFGTLPDGTDGTGPGMFAQSDAAALRVVLADAGFTDIAIEARTLPLPLGATAAEAVDYLADSGPGRAILETVPADRHDDAIAAVTAALRPHHEPGRGVTLDAAILVTTARTQR